MKATHRITWNANGIENEVVGSFEDCCRLFLILKYVDNIDEVTQSVVCQKQGMFKFLRIADRSADPNRYNKPRHNFDTGKTRV